MATVNVIVNKALCCGCGACAKTCPTKSIQYVRNVAGYIVPEVASSCVDCGLCLKVCPSNAMKATMDSVDGDPFVGNCINGYIGCALDKNLRIAGQSGGVVSAFLLWLLKTGKIDGAIVNQFNKITKRNEAVYVDTEEGILSGCGSYYAQSTVVDTVLSNKDKRLAVVAIGCQTLALEKLKRTDRLLRENLLVLGLICGGNYSGDYIKDLISLAGGGRCDKVDGFRFRFKEHGGWPGNVCVWFEDSAVTLPSARRIERKELYLVPRCQVCFDRMNVFSDIVFGDPWGINWVDNGFGNTVAITRTGRGDGLFSNFISSGVVAMDRISPEDINKGQRVNEVTRANFYSCERENRFDKTSRLMLAKSEDEVNAMRNEILRCVLRMRRKKNFLFLLSKMIKPVWLVYHYVKKRFSYV